MPFNLRQNLVHQFVQTDGAIKAVAAPQGIGPLIDEQFDAHLHPQQNAWLAGITDATIVAPKITPGRTANLSKK